MRHSFQKPAVTLSTLRRKNAVFKCIRFGERFQKSYVFLDQKRRLSVDVRPKLREKDVFSNKNLLVWTWPKTENTSLHSAPLDHFEHC